MGTVSTLATFQNFVWPVHKMNKSSLAFAGKLNWEQFSAKFNFKLEFSSLFEADHREKVQLGMRGGHWGCICYVIIVMYSISVVWERIQLWPYLNFTNIKMYLFSKGNIFYHKWTVSTSCHQFSHQNNFSFKQLMFTLWRHQGPLTSSGAPALSS